MANADAATTKPSPPPISRGTWILAAALFSLIVAGGAIFVVASRSKEVVERPRFVVVEKPGSESQPAVNSVGSLAPTAEPVAREPTAPPTVPPGSASAQAPRGPNAERTFAPSTGPDAKALSRAFQKQQGRIENCFVSHVKEVDGRPEVSVKFRVDASGKVISAELAPSALNATPLGGCIIAVARSTDFGHQPEPFSFTIPITARRVK